MTIFPHPNGASTSCMLLQNQIQSRDKREGIIITEVGITNLIPESRTSEQE